jgi:hypothetical protein
MRKAVDSSKAAKNAPRISGTVRPGRKSARLAMRARTEETPLLSSFSPRSGEVALRRRRVRVNKIVP